MKIFKSTLLSLVFLLLLISFIQAQSITNGSYIDINANLNNLDAQISSNPTIIEMFNSIDRYRSFSWNYELINLDSKNIGDTIMLTFFEDARYSAEIMKAYVNDGGRTVITAEINDNLFAYVIITVSNEAISMSAKIPENDEYFFASVKHGQAWLGQARLSEMDLDKLPCDLTNNLDHYLHDHEHCDGHHDEMIWANSNDPITIDLLYVYTPAAVQWASAAPNVTDIQHLIDITLELSNLVMANSNTGVTFNIVHRHLTNYVETNSPTDLQRLTNTNDGYMDEVHVLRSTYYADLIVFLANINYTGGAAWLLNSYSGFTAVGFDNHAVSINRVQQASWTYTIVHEIGHNMGAHHHRGQTTQAGPNGALGEYAAGWRGSIQGSLRNTVMTYGDGSYWPGGQSSTDIPYFSSPLITVNGTVIGNAVLEDNARIIRDTKVVTASYRVPPASYDLSAQSIIGSTHISVGTASSYTVRVINTGQNIANDYIVRLMLAGNNTPLDWVNGSTLTTGNFFDFNLSWTPDEIGQMQIYGEIVWSLDEIPGNNQTPYLNVNIYPDATIYQENFDSGTSLSDIGWGGELSGQSNIQPYSGVNNTNGLVLSVWGGAPIQYAYTPIIGPVTTESEISFAYRIVHYTTNWQGQLYPATLGNGDSIDIEISTTGATGDYFQLYQINNTNHLASINFVTINQPIFFLSGQIINIRFRGLHTTGEWMFVLDDVSIADAMSPPPIFHPPINLQASVEGNNVNLSWEAPNSRNTQNTSFLGYRVYRGISLLTPNYLSTLTFTEYSVPNGSYTYIVTAQYTLGESEPVSIDVIVDFYPPNPAINPTPMNNATNIPLSQSLSWQPSTTGSTPTGYRIYFGLTDPPPLLQNNSTATTWVPPNLIENTLYFWSIVPFNASGEADNCPVWNFSTINNQPTFSINPTFHNFGNIIVSETSPPQTFAITNIGNSPLVINSIEIPVGNDFSLGNVSNLPWTLLPNATQQFTATFSPTGTGYQSVYIEIIDNVIHLNYLSELTNERVDTNHNNREIHQVLLSGTGVMNIPEPAINPTPINNATNVPLNQILSWQPANNGSTPTGYRIHFGDTNPPPLVQNNWTSTTWTPPTIIENTIYYWRIVPFNIAGEAENCPIWNFTTINNQPVFSINPTFHNFGNIIVSESSPPQTFAITNIGNSSLIISSIEIPIDNDFSLGNVSNLPWTLLPNATQQFTATFSPTATGYQSVYIEIIDNVIHINYLSELTNERVDTNHNNREIHQVLLTGTGVMNIPEPAINPTPINNATNVPLNQILSWQPANTGSTPTGYRIHFGDTNPPPLVQNNWTSTSWTPPTIAENTIYFWRIVPFNIAGEAENCPIWNFATNNNEPIFSINPTFHNFGQILVYESSPSQTFTITNIGTGSLIINSIEIPEADDFNLGNVSNLPWNILPNDTRQFNVTFSPTSIGYQSAFIIINDNMLSLNYSSNRIDEHIDLNNENREIHQVLIDGTGFMNIPHPAINPIPINNATSIPLNQLLSWHPASTGGSPIGYRIHFGTTNPPPLVENNWTTTSWSPSDMEENTMYYWRIIPFNMAGNAANCPVWNFTTLFNEPVFSISPTFYNFGHVLIYESSPAQDFIITNIGTSPLVIISIEIPETNDFSLGNVSNLPWTILPNDTRLFSVTFSPTSIGYKSADIVIIDNIDTITYDYREIHQVFIDGMGNTNLPYPAMNPIPQDNATDILTTQILSWSPDTTGDVPTGYRIYFGTTNPPPLVQENWILTSWTPETMQNNIQYFWRIVPFNEHSEAINCPIWSFTTISNPAIITIDPSSYNFGTVVVGTISELQTFTIFNTGGSPLLINTITLSGDNQDDFNIISDDLPWSIEIGNNKPFYVSFSPISSGNKSAELNIMHNADDSPSIVALSALALEAPLFSISPISYDFSEIVVGQNSYFQTFTISNIGGSPLIINAIIKEGTNQDEFDIYTAGLPWTVATGGNRTFTARFSPTSIGNKIADLIITHNAENSPERVTLTGIGFDPPIFSINPISFNFGDIKVGESSDPQLFTITNLGGSPLIINTIVKIGVDQYDFDLSTNELPWTIAKNEFRTFNVSFSPLTAGYKTALITVIHNAENSPNLINITGGGTVSITDILEVKTELLGNYPNPFNPVTTINFNLEIESIVQIDIFDIRGSKLITLVDNVFSAGKHQIIWNGQDDFGHELGSGLYFYRMKTDDYVSVKRMMLLK
ncbi:MAG: choice-of-anchor D domain-containing protein [Candidatus Cloacimonetes bacterium]|nr:choice-of-anchor D domain-containing protein [Candidatus Cloacimonadota bacterium]